jgi:hypothetical protein
VTPAAPPREPERRSFVLLRVPAATCCGTRLFSTWRDLFRRAPSLPPRLQRTVGVGQPHSGVHPSAGCEHEVGQGEWGAGEPGGFGGAIGALSHSAPGAEPPRARLCCHRRRRRVCVISGEPTSFLHAGSNAKAQMEFTHAAVPAAAMVQGLGGWGDGGRPDARKRKGFDLPWGKERSVSQRSRLGHTREGPVSTAHSRAQTTTFKTDYASCLPAHPGASLSSRGVRGMELGAARRVDPPDQSRLLLAAKHITKNHQINEPASRRPCSHARAVAAARKMTLGV